MFIYFRLKEQPVRDLETTRPTPPAEDVEERLSTDNTSHAEPVASLELKREDVH